MLPYCVMEQKFRKGVVAVLVNQAGEILLCERSDIPGSWQFPQGGIESGESEERAVRRELLEEIGTNACEVLAIGKELTVYFWPKPFADSDRVGQEMRWFLLRFHEGQGPDLSVSDGCFQAFEWLRPELAIERIVSFKKESFRRGLQQLGLLP